LLHTKSGVAFTPVIVENNLRGATLSIALIVNDSTTKKGLVDALAEIRPILDDLMQDLGSDLSEKNSQALVEWYRMKNERISYSTFAVL
jgi:hypothetical protein